MEYSISLFLLFLFFFFTHQLEGFLSSHLFRFFFAFSDALTQQIAVEETIYLKCSCVIGAGGINQFIMDQFARIFLSDLLQSGLIIITMGIGCDLFGAFG